MQFSQISLPPPSSFLEIPLRNSLKKSLNLNWVWRLNNEHNFGFVILLLRDEKKGVKRMDVETSLETPFKVKEEKKAETFVRNHTSDDKSWIIQPSTQSGIPYLGKQL